MPVKLETTIYKDEIGDWYFRLRNENGIESGRIYECSKITHKGYLYVLYSHRMSDYFTSGTDTTTTNVITTPMEVSFTEMPYRENDSAWLEYDCVMCGTAILIDNAQLKDTARLMDAKLYNNAIMSGRSRASNGADISGDARIEDGAEITNARVAEHAIIKGYASVRNRASIYGWASIKDRAIVSGSMVYDHAEVYGDAAIKDNSGIYGNAKIYGNAIVGSSYVKDSAEVYDNARVRDNAIICENARICGSAIVETCTISKKFCVTSGVTNYDMPKVKLFKLASSEKKKAFHRKNKAYLIHDNNLIRINNQTFYHNEFCRHIQGNPEGCKIPYANILKGSIISNETYGDFSKCNGVINERLVGNVSGLSGCITNVIGDATGIIFEIKKEYTTPIDVRSFISNPDLSSWKLLSLEDNERIYDIFRALCFSTLTLTDEEIAKINGEIPCKNKPPFPTDEYGRYYKIIDNDTLLVLSINPADFGFIRTGGNAGTCFRFNGNTMECSNHSHAIDHYANCINPNGGCAFILRKGKHETLRKINYFVNTEIKPFKFWNNQIETFNFLYDDESIYLNYKGCASTTSLINHCPVDVIYPYKVKSKEEALVPFYSGDSYYSENANMKHHATHPTLYRLIECTHDEWFAGSEIPNSDKRELAIKANKRIDEVLKKIKGEK